MHEPDIERHLATIQNGVADVDDVFGEESGGMYGLWGSEGIAREIEKAKIVLLDGNLSVDDLREMVGVCRRMRKDVWFEATSVAKSTRIVDGGVLGEVRYVSGNVCEVVAMSARLRKMEHAMSEASDGDDGDGNEIELTGIGILGIDGMDKRTLLITRGAKGVSLMWRTNNGEFCRRDIEAAALSGVVSTTGAGDCVAGRCAGGIAVGEDLEVALNDAVRLAAWSCSCDGSVPEKWHKQVKPRL